MAAVAIARMSPRWATRMGLVALAFTAFAVWCLYDANVGYPRFNRRATEHNRLLAAGRADTWPACAAENGWSANFRDEDRRTDGTIVLKSSWDIGTQYVMMVASLAVALLAGGRVWRSRRRTLRADGAGFLTVEGVLVPYAEITGIDLKLWQRKSIARVSFRQGDRALTTLIDDWIYQGGEDVLAEIQRRTGLGAEALTAPERTSPDAAQPEKTPPRGPERR